MFSLPTSVFINGQPYGITQKGDYRMVLDCFTALNDIELDKTERIYSALIIFYEDINSIEDIFNEFNEEGLIVEAVKEMYSFFDCGQNGVGANMNYKIIDWEQDEQLIASSVNKVAGVEIRAVEYLHWWTFMGYYIAVGQGVLSTVCSIRDKIVKGKKLEDYEKEFKYDNPQYFEWNHKTLEEQELDKELDLIVKNWNEG